MDIPSHTFQLETKGEYFPENPLNSHENYCDNIDKRPINMDRRKRFGFTMRMVLCVSLLKNTLPKPRIPELPQGLRWTVYHVQKKSIFKTVVVKSSCESIHLLT